MSGQAKKRSDSFHLIGVICGLTAGAWLGAAEAPCKLVTIVGLSPVLISLCMVGGVFVARWTLPTLLKGSKYVFADLGEKAHLMVWAVLAGALWAVGNTLSMYAIRDVGLSIAFPLWNVNSLIGVFWGWAFFRELRGADSRTYIKVIGGALAIVSGAILLGCASAHHDSKSAHRTAAGVAAALGAALMWGTMYIPYRKAYMSGMNPLSFVTIFIFGELLSMCTLAVVITGGIAPLVAEIQRARAALFWLFMGGFCWTVGELFQQYAAKYIGISRGIPLSNTNQLWGLAWGALVFGELAGTQSSALLVVAGSLVMILGAVAISAAAAPNNEQSSWAQATVRECQRYNMPLARVQAAQNGDDPLASEVSGRRWWDFLIVVGALAVFGYLASIAQMPSIAMDRGWMTVLLLATLATLGLAGAVVWKFTRFS